MAPSTIVRWNEAKCPVITIKSPACSATEKPFLRDAMDEGEVLAHSIGCTEEAISGRCSETRL